MIERCSWCFTILGDPNSPSFLGKKIKEIKKVDLYICKNDCIDDD